MLRDEAVSDPQLQLLDYFDEIYVSGAFRLVRERRPNQRIVQRFRRQAPLYPPEKWNLFQRTLNGTDRTNNSSEGWNNAYKQLVGHVNPTIWKSIKAIRLDETRVHTALVQHSAGRDIQPTHPPKRKYQDLNTRLTNLCKRYEGNISEFITAVSRNIVSSRR